MSAGEAQEAADRHKSPPAHDRPTPSDGQEGVEGQAHVGADSILAVAGEFVGPGAGGDAAYVSERRRVYGNEMLYVSLADGAKVGRINLITGKVTMDQTDLRPQFDKAVARFREDDSGRSSAAPSRPVIIDSRSEEDLILPPPSRLPPR